MKGLWLMRIHKAGTAEALRSPGPAAHLCGGFIRLVQVSVGRMVVGALGLGCLPVTMGLVSQRTAGTCKYVKGTNGLCPHISRFVEAFSTSIEWGMWHWVSSEAVLLRRR